MIKDKNAITGRGFTLIELLVVVAIIGLLAAIVITSVSGARQKGIDVSVKSQMSHLRTMAETFYGAGNANTYLGFCGTTTTTTALKNAQSAYNGIPANVQVNAAGDGAKVTCNASATGWAAEAPLSGSVSGTAKMWCVDSQGNSVGKATALASATTFSCQ
jgi:prepilin-type N-terminal cleavage/methylation domain-containing protein